jgi:uncharacterized caspase-like protein
MQSGSISFYGRWSSSARARPTSCSSTPAATTRWRATWRARWVRARPASARGSRTFIAYSTQPGNVALDGDGRNSPFTAALARRITEPDRSLTSVMIEVRKDVLSATDGKQVPWDHSALTGEFLFHQVSAPGSLPKVAPQAPDGDAVQRRLRQLEEEVKRKSDPAQTAKMVELAQAKERLRQLDEANRQDQKQIFDMQYDTSRSSDTTSRRNPSFEVGAIQVRMAKRGQEQKALRDQIAKLEAELGLAAGASGAATK